GGVVVATRAGSSRLATTRPASAPRAIADVAQTRNLTQLGPFGCARSPAFADARTIAFDLTRGDVVDLYRMAVSGGAATPIATSPLWEWNANPGPRARGGGPPISDMNNHKSARGPARHPPARPQT